MNVLAGAEHNTSTCHKQCTGKVTSNAQVKSWVFPVFKNPFGFTSAVMPRLSSLPMDANFLIEDDIHIMNFSV